MKVSKQILKTHENSGGEREDGEAVDVKYETEGQWMVELSNFDLRGFSSLLINVRYQPKAVDFFTEIFDKWTFDRIVEVTNSYAYQNLAKNAPCLAHNGTS